MFVFNLFSPTSRDGVIFRLKQTSPKSYSPYRWDRSARTWVEGDIGMDRFMALPGATPGELIAAGITTSDLSQS